MEEKKMAMIKVGFRAGETGNWGTVRQRATLAGETGRIRAGDSLEDRARLVALRQPLTVSHLDAIKPEMITSGKLSFNVMKETVTVAMFRQFVEDSGYKIVGHNAEELTALLADHKKSDHPLTYVNHDDTTAFVNWRKEKTGEALRVPTGDEWLAAKREVGNQLIGSLWEWTQTIYSGVSKVLRSLGSGGRGSADPGDRCVDAAFRLVEDKSK